MSLVILTARPELQSHHRLREEADSLGVDLRLIDATKVEAELGRSPALWHEKVNLLESAPRFILARVGNWRPESVLAALEVAVAAGVATINPPPAIRLGRDHWLTAELLARHAVPVPSSMVGADPESLADRAVSRLGLPVVVKSRRSRMGVGVILCRERDHLEAVLDSLWRLGDELLVQRFLPCNGRSVRLLVANGQVVASASFAARNQEWRSNTARGGSASTHTPSPTEQELALTAANTLGLGLCGVDLLQSDNQWWVCEVNPTPGFRGLEAATGTNVARAIVQAASSAGSPR